MKTTFAAALLTALIAMLPLTARCEVDPLDENATRSLESAIASMDEGEIEVSIAMLEALLEKYPDNFCVNYELAYARFFDNDYQKSLEIAMPLLEHPDTSPLVFTLIGSCYDEIGRTEDAINIYDRGIAKFPESALLYLNKGICLQRKDKLTEALEEYENAIVADPTYDSPYYQAARIYAISSMPMWALIYAETFNILSQRSDRKEEMSKLILDILKEKITFNGKKISVKLASGVIADADSTKPLFEHTFEITCGIGAMAILYGWTYETVSDLRSKALTAFTNIITPTNRMALQKFQKAILDAGHWDAYNYIIMQYAFPEESAKWIEQPENQEKLNNFTDFIRKYDEPIIDADHTVSSRLVNKD